MLIESRALKDIIPYENNPRLNDSAVEAVAASIREFGFKVPIVVDADGVVVTGHTRLKAAHQLGMTEVPVIVAKDLSAEQIKAYRIADNKTSELADWDYDLLPIELSQLGDTGFDLDLLGFDDKELNKLLDPGVREGLTDPDEVPEPPDEPITQPGDLWILGDHRLLCGDSGNPDDVDRLLDGADIHLVNTDPPYNVKVEPRSNNAIASADRKGHGLPSPDQSQLLNHQGFDLARYPGKSKPATTRMRAKDRPLANDFISDDEFEKKLLAWFGNMERALAPGCSFYIWAGAYPGSGGAKGNYETYPQTLRAVGLKYSQLIIWDKQHPVLTRKDMMGAHESCFYGWKEGAAHRWLGPTNITDLWHVKKVSPQRMQHLTEKPVELAVRAIQYSSQGGENVLDLFGGSGSTLIAAEQTGRNAYLMELDAPYADVIVQRWEQFTGQTAERHVKGLPHESANVA